MALAGWTNALIALSVAHRAATSARLGLNSTLKLVSVRMLSASWPSVKIAQRVASGDVIDAEMTTILMR